METRHPTDLDRKPNIEANSNERLPEGKAGIHPMVGYDLNSCAARFMSAAAFGIKLDGLIFLVFGAAVLAGGAPGTMGLLYTLIEVPVICGILGIFFYTEMQDLAEDFVQTIMRRRRFFR